MDNHQKEEPVTLQNGPDQAMIVSILGTNANLSCDHQMNEASGVISVAWTSKSWDQTDENPKLPQSDRCAASLAEAAQ